MDTLKNKWYVQWFLYCCHILDNIFPYSDEFKNKHDYIFRSRYERYNTQSNLCSFFKILLGGTILGIINILIILYSVYVFLILPFLLFPALSFILSLSLIIGGIVICTGLIFGIVWSMCFGVPTSISYIKEKINDENENGFIKACYLYFLGLKNKYCPTIKFKE